MQLKDEERAKIKSYEQSLDNRTKPDPALATISNTLQKMDKKIERS
jgi:hypothetical protein